MGVFGDVDLCAFVIDLCLCVFLLVVLGVLRNGTDWRGGYISKLIDGNMVSSLCLASQSALFNIVSKSSA